MYYDHQSFYFLGNNWQRRIEKIGKETSYDPTEALATEDRAYSPFRTFSSGLTYRARNSVS